MAVPIGIPPKCVARVSAKSVLQECLRQVSSQDCLPSVSFKTVSQECLSRVSFQECAARVFQKSVPTLSLNRASQESLRRVSPKSVRVSGKSVSQDCLSTACRKSGVQALWYKAVLCSIVCKLCSPK